MSIVATNVLGGPFNGYSPKQTNNAYKTSDDVLVRGVLRRVWNKSGAIGEINGKNRVVTPFRAVNNLGDFLGRQDYICGGANQVNSNISGVKMNGGAIRSQCDGTNIESASCNTKFVADSSDYIIFRKQRAMNRNYNDSSNGGDQSNASASAIKRVHRF